MIEKVVGVNGFDIEVPLSEHMAFLTYVDRPGVVGSVGRLLGDAGVNIGGMQVARDAAGGHVLMVLTVDTLIPAAVLSEISQEIGATTARVADLDD
jgi:D-3-phosphoglycerate dehydrogenase